MSALAIGNANYRICRTALPLLALIAMSTVAWGDHSSRATNSASNRLRPDQQSQDDPQDVWDDQIGEAAQQPAKKKTTRNYDASRVTLNSKQKVRTANQTQPPAKTRSPEPSVEVPQAQPRKKTGKQRTRKQRTLVEVPIEQASGNRRSERVDSAVRQASTLRQAPKLSQHPAPVTQSNLEQVAYCDNCGSSGCDGGCCDLVEPVCGLEPGCGCDTCCGTCDPVCGIEAGCGCEPACGLDVGCGCEVACGCEDACDGYRLKSHWYDPYRHWYGKHCDWNQFSIRGEYLLWWVDGFYVPPLLTTSTDGTAVGDAGVLGLASTSIVYGNQNVLEDARSGGRLTLNYWFDCDRCRGIEAIYTGLAQESSTFTANSQQYPILARPFFNVEPGTATQDAELIAYPNLLEGSATIRTESTLQGVEILYRHSICRGCCFSVDGLLGYRYNNLNEAVHFSDSKRVLSDDFGLPEGTTLEESDWFETENSFNGAEIGVIAQRCHCNWTLEGVMKMALGNNHSEVNVDGHATFNVPGAQPPVTTTPAGLLAQQSNIGRQERDDFSMIPELGATLGYDINCHWRATVGYTFMYWCGVARPGDQIDTDLNLTQLEQTGLQGIARPASRRFLTDVWAQGFRFGLACNY